MHIDYAAESFVRMTKPVHTAPLADRQVVEANVTYPEFLAVADAIGDEKTSSIVATIRKNANNKYAKVTPAQRYALATALIAKHGSALAVYAAAFGVTVEQFEATIAAI